MAAYAALVSLINTITLEQTPRHHPHPHPQISFDGELIEALQDRANFLVEFLEEGWKRGQDLEGRIADAAHAAEDAIESYVVDHFLPGDKSSGEKGSVLLGEVLGNIVQKMDSIKNEAIEIKEKVGIKDVHGASFRSSSAPHQGEKIKMVGFEDAKIQVMEELTGWNSGRTVISIVGMGGAGKTTLARNIFDDELIVQYFDVHTWITVSQEYNVNHILKEILSVLKEQGNEELGVQVHKGLSGRRYLIVLDDIWSLDVWDEIKRYFPDNNNGSRIMVTTRLSNLAKELSTCSIEMKCLDKDNSWNLLCQIVFAQNNCPLELVDVGKKIAQNCNGLPLAIVVTGGLLAKFNKSIEYWEHVAKLSSPGIYLDEEHCSRILSLSYDHLPVHLKPCFLYMGVFPEDHEIRVSKLVNVWVAEGFLKPRRGKNVKGIAEECLLDLIERNLIRVHKRGSSGNIKSCTIHDLLREFCLRKAQKENFLYVVTRNSPSVPLSMNCQRRFVIRLNTSKTKNDPVTIDSLLSTSHARSLIVNNYEALSSILVSPFLRLLRVIFVIDENFREYYHRHERLSENLFNLVNLRYVSCIADSNFNNRLASSIGLFRNLQMLIVRNIWHPTNAPSEIWNLPQLHHVEFEKISLVEPSCGEQEHAYIFLQNLWALKGLHNFRFDEGIIKKISNIRKMKVGYDANYKEWSHYNLHNLGLLQKLESFHCYFHGSDKNPNELLPNVCFPHSLKKLCLYRCRFLWKDMTLIGSLPNLEVLKLKFTSFYGAEWNPVEGEFCRLKFLYMEILSLTNWNADSTHFPSLEQLVLHRLHLKEIPLDIGEIATLKLIQLEHCLDSAVISAKNIVEEQQSLGNDELVVRVVTHDRKYKEFCSLESKNFIIRKR